MLAKPVTANTRARLTLKALIAHTNVQILTDNKTEVDAPRELRWRVLHVQWSLSEHFYSDFVFGF